LIDKLEQKLSRISIKHFFSVTAPLIESIAIHEFCLRKGIVPILLPHSFTSSHEFHPNNYKQSVSFVWSKDILPSANLHKDILKKEILVNFTRIEKRNAKFLSQRKGNFLDLKLKRLISGYSFSQALNLSFFKLKSYLKNQANKKKISSAEKSRIFIFGLLLNFEHYEFHCGLNFNHFFECILNLSTKIYNFYGDSSIISIRAKPGWTNLSLFKRYQSQFGDTNSNIVISPESINLAKYGEMCNLVIFFQGTSAIAELMIQGVACIQIKDQSLIKLESDYVKFPEDVVPVLEFEQIVSKLREDEFFIAKTAEMQKKWMSKHTLNKST